MRHWMNVGGQFITKAAMATPATKIAQKNYTLQGYNLGETGKAVKFEIHQINGTPLEHPKSEWFPFSQMKSSTKAAPGSDEFDNLVVSEWICKQKSLV